MDPPVPSVSQVGSGGNLGEYAEARVNFGADSGPGGAGTVRVFTSFSGATWDPSVQGDILSTSWSIDLLNLSGNVPVFYFALRQGNIAYRSDGDFFFPPAPPFNVDPVWTTFTKTGLVATDFREFINDISGTVGGNGNDPSVYPDLSPAGGPIEFGYIFFSGAGEGDPDRFVGVDNWSVTLDVVPEPASLALIGLGGLLMVSRRRTH